MYNQSIEKRLIIYEEKKEVGRRNYYTGVYNRDTCLSGYGVPGRFLVGFCAGCYLFGGQNYNVVYRQIVSKTVKLLKNNPSLHM